MSVPRRAYFFVACFFSLQATAWAAVNLLRTILDPQRGDPASTAFWIAVIVVALPAFLAHWRVAERTARRDASERGSALRRLYLLVTLVFLMFPVLANASGLISEGVRMSLGLLPSTPSFGPGPDGARTAVGLIGRNFVAIVILGTLWFYHARVVRGDRAAGADAPTLRTLDRLYVLGFAAVGSVLAALGTIHTLRWLLQQVVGTGRSSPAALPDELARILIGLTVWVAAWTIAQRRYCAVSARGPDRPADPDEQRSALRKVYLYGWLFTAAFGTVANAAGILAGALRRLLGLEVSGDPLGPLPVILVLPFFWAYHHRVLQRDAATETPAGRAEAVRRLYLYLVAAIGFAVGFVGTAGVLRVLIRSLLDTGFGPDLKSQLAWFTAAVIVGVPAWIIPWRSLRQRALATDDAARAERRSPIRRLYLYFFLAASLLVVLASATYVVYRLVATVVGADLSGSLAGRLAESIAFAAIGAGAWLLHSGILREDEGLGARARDERLAALSPVLLVTGDGTFARDLIEACGRALPALRLQFLPLAEPAAAGLGIPWPPDDTGGMLGNANLIIGQAGLATLADSTVSDAIAQSSARILLVPAEGDRVLWAGVDAADDSWQIEQLVQAIGQLADGVEVQPKRPLSAGQAVGIGLLSIVFLILAVAIVGFVGVQMGSLFD